jgi:large subunit ribosomal protein L20|tara:strand:- start:19201 stop:19557 length:357 start_codon:yes stop_codon:yes gene_type:complete
MVRITRGSHSRFKHKKVLNAAKGYKGAHSKLFRPANQQVMKALCYSYSHRKKQKRAWRSLWIRQINGAANQQGTNYSRFISQLKTVGVGLNRMQLAQLANLDTKTFKLLTTPKNIIFS